MGHLIVKDTLWHFRPVQGRHITITSVMNMVRMQWSQYASGLFREFLNRAYKNSYNRCCSTINPQSPTLPKTTRCLFLLDFCSLLKLANDLFYKSSLLYNHMYLLLTQSLTKPERIRLKDLSPCDYSCLVPTQTIQIIFSFPHHHGKKTNSSFQTLNVISSFPLSFGMLNSIITYIFSHP